MYNLYAFEKKNARKQPDEGVGAEQRGKIRDVLTAKYRERMNTNIMLLSENAAELPVRSRSPEGRSLMNRSLGGTGNKVSRVKEVCVYDSSPSSKKAFSLRPREKLKEIQPHLKFRLVGTERLKEMLKVQKEFLETSVAPKASSRGSNKPSSKWEDLKQTSGKTVFGYYHNKLHFKTIESIALDLHGSIRNASKDDISKRHRELSLGLTDIHYKIPLDSLSKEESIPISADLLEKYGFWREKRNKTPIIR